MSGLRHGDRQKVMHMGPTVHWHRRTKKADNCIGFKNIIVFTYLLSRSMLALQSALTAYFSDFFAHASWQNSIFTQISPNRCAQYIFKGSQPLTGQLVGSRTDIAGKLHVSLLRLISHVGGRCTVSAALKVGFLGTSIEPQKSALILYLFHTWNGPH